MSCSKIHWIMNMLNGKWKCEFVCWKKKRNTVVEKTHCIDFYTHLPFSWINLLITISTQPRICRVHFITNGRFRVGLNHFFFKKRNHSSMLHSIICIPHVINAQCTHAKPAQRALVHYCTAPHRTVAWTMPTPRSFTGNLINCKRQQ